MNKKQIWHTQYNLRSLHFSPETNMKKITMNPYIGYAFSKGRDEFSYPAKLGKFPKTVQGVRFETEEEYRAAIHEMLNGM